MFSGLGARVVWILLKRGFRAQSERSEYDCRQHAQALLHGGFRTMYEGGFEGRRGGRYSCYFYCEVVLHVWYAVRCMLIISPSFSAVVCSNFVYIC